MSAVAPRSAPPPVLPAPPRAPAPVSRRELAAWTALFLALAGVRLIRGGGPQYMNDSYQYLSVAENLRLRGELATSIVHFDAERARAVLPAPETTFPPGYPAAIRALGWAGLAPAAAALLLSLLSGAAVLPLLAAAARALRLPAGAARLALLVWAASAQATLYATTLYAEALFTALTLAALVLLLGRAARSGPGWRGPAAAALLGLAVAVRYAGLFLAGALHLLALAQAARDRRRRLAWLLVPLACDVLVAPILIRNALVAGTWMGGNGRPVHRGLAVVLHRLGVAGWELAVGSVSRAPPPTLLVAAALLAVGVAGLAASLAWAACRGPRLRPTAAPEQLATLAGAAAAYVAGMVLAGAVTQISLNARMFVPLLPALALLAGLLVAAAPGFLPLARGSARWALAATAAVGYAGAQVASTLEPPRVPEYRAVAAALAAPAEDGRPLAAWIEAHVPPDAPLLAVEGQATGHVLRRPTLSAAGRDFTELAWDEAETRRAAAALGVRWIIVYPEVVASGGVDHLDSELFRRLAARRPPGWTALAAENGRALVYRARP